MSKQNVVQEVVIPCAAGDDHVIDGNIAYKTDQWTPEHPAENLLCNGCSTVLLDNRTGRQVKLDDIRVMVAALAIEEVSEATAVDEVDPGVETVVLEAVVAVELPVPDEVAANVVVAKSEAPAKPRICPICVEVIPDGHPYPKHHRCHTAADLVVRSVSGLQEAKRRITEAEEFLGDERERTIAKLAEKRIVGEDETLAFESAQVFLEKAYAAMAKMDYLRAVQLAWLAKDAVAERYVIIMSEWLAGQVEEFRNEGFLTDDRQGILPQPLDKYLVDIEYEMGKGRYLPAFYLLKGNHEKGPPGVFYRVGYVKQRYYTGKLVEAMQTELAAIRMIDPDYEIQIPDDLRKSYQRAQQLCDSNPWKCWDVAEGVKQALKEIHGQVQRAAEEAEVAAFLESRTLGGRAHITIVSDDAPEFAEEFVGGAGGGRANHKAKVRSDQGDGKGLKRVKKPEKEFRGGRGDQRRQMIDEALTVEPVPA